MILPKHILGLYGAASLPVALSLFLLPEASLKSMHAPRSAGSDELMQLIVRWWGLAALTVPVACFVLILTGSERTHSIFLKYFAIPYQLWNAALSYKHYSLLLDRRLVKHESWLGPFHLNFLLSIVFVAVGAFALLNIRKGTEAVIENSPERVEEHIEKQAAQDTHVE